MMIKHYCDKCGRQIIGQVYKAEIRCRKLLSMDSAKYDLDEKCAREMVGESAIAQHAEKEAERTARCKEREQERLYPQPLTWEELSGMVGEPVWTIGECCGLDGWDIIEEVYDDSVLFGRSTEQPEKWRYNLRELNGDLLACAWVCYRTKPEGSAE